MSLLESLLAKLQRHPKRIVFPEGADPRVLQTARMLAARRCGVPILLGDRETIKDNAARLDLRLDGIRIMEPERSDDIDLFLPMLDSNPRFSSLDLAAKQELLADRHNFAAFMLTSGRADALVGGATMTASSGLRSLFRIVPRQAQVDVASSLLIMDQDQPPFGTNGLLFMADCGVLPEPSAAQLADIAVATARIAWHLTGDRPRVAFLSFATCATKLVHPSQARLREALALAIDKAAAARLPADFAGEWQLDAALSAEVARHKGVGDSPVAGRANVLVFPDLNAANIAAKVVQLIAGARTYGQIITGMQFPCAEISRGAHVSDVFGTAVITACQAIDRRLLTHTDCPS
jgi:phosphate acetyltransferase